MKRIREFYGVPAKRGMRIVFNGKPVIITGTTRGPMYLRVRPLEGGKPYPIHPTWNVEYPEVVSVDLGGEGR